MIHKATNSRSKTGVADYFAVLGIPSFADESDEPTNASENDDNEVQSSNQVNLSTPRSDNLSSSLHSEEAGGAVAQESSLQLPQPDGEELTMHQERFDREIVRLALVDASDLELGKEWAICQSHQTNNNFGNAAAASGSTADGVDAAANDGKLDLYGVPLNISGAHCPSVQVAYQRRGHQTAHVEHAADAASPSSTFTPSKGKKEDEDYYIPAVADVTVHYVKVHPLSIPNYTFVNNHSNLQQQQQQQSSIPNTDRSSNNTKSIPIPSTATAVAQGAAKTLSSLARRTTGLTVVAKGKEIVNELNLANVVKGVTSRRASSNEDASHHHLYDTGAERGESDETISTFNNNFASVHGDMPRWKEMPQCSGVSGSGTARREHFFPDTPGDPKVVKRSKYEPHDSKTPTNDIRFISDNNEMLNKSLSEMLPLPQGYEEWIIPPFCQTLHLPTSHRLKKMQQQKLLDSSQQLSSGGGQPILLDRTHVLPSPVGKIGRSSPSSMGVEAMYISPLSSPVGGENRKELSSSVASSSSGGVSHGDGKDSLTSSISKSVVPDPSVMPSLVSWKAVSTSSTDTGAISDYVYIPILAVRRQRVGEEERFHEDSAVVDIQISHVDSDGVPYICKNEDEDDDENNTKPMMHNCIHPNILKRSPWIPSQLEQTTNHKSHPILLIRRNMPNEFADLPFPARVLDRFPQKNYRDMPFPEEELPMFCYARGSLLVRDKLRNLPMPKSFGFVVKNERGDSIYVSCLSFLEPLTMQRKAELDKLSNRRQKTSLPHRLHYQRAQSKRPRTIFDNCLMVGFDDIVTFESKTICLVGRYPYWTAFRHFLTHLHLLSGLSSDTPLERHISHLLLSVPIPKPGGQCILVPLSTMREPMALLMPPVKDLPLLDLSYKMLFSALDVPTVVTIVLGFLCLEKKVILTSTRQSLVLDCCELLKSLLFPFELCAPYVPHLTAPFMSCLEFPGATFVGIHDDGESDGLANVVRDCIPEDSIIVELDSGEIKCDGNRYETLKAAYQIIPSDVRSVLIKEVESLCQDAGIIPGSEPLDYGIESMIDSSVPSNMVESFGNKNNHTVEPLDDRAIRDCFLRFFCSILGGYERFLVVPDADFLISGNDWFDSAKFLAAAPPARNQYLNALVGTQLFQSFVQRRTEASDVHCVLFDECLVEYFSSKVPYGLRGNGDLLVDQCATEPDSLVGEDESSFVAKSEPDDKSFSQPGSDTGTNVSFDSEIPFALNSSGDIVTVPSVLGLPPNSRFVYCTDGQPAFPMSFHRVYFLPQEPELLCSESDESPAPILTRSDREREEAARMLNMSISKRGPQKQHRCLWQLPKFMGSQFLGTWLMCIPSQLSQPNLSVHNKSTILLRALGALRTMRSHKRIIADEAAYRALIVACGKCGTDRRVELMKLYGLMRTDAIFPNAVTLGQYTRAIAEGYSRRTEDTQGKVGMQINMNASRTIAPFNLDFLDSNLQLLEESGQKWRSQGTVSQHQGALATRANESTTDQKDATRVISPAKTFDTATTTQRPSKQKRAWLPITCSSSFHVGPNDPNKQSPVGLLALWSRAVSCDSCDYIPLDEEIQQCGWDVFHSGDESMVCPRCGSVIIPLIGYQHLEISEALAATDVNPHSLDDDLNSSRDSATSDLPPQLEGAAHNFKLPLSSTSQQGFVSYFSPYKLRLMLEHLVEEHGEEVLRRDRLLSLDPHVFYNLWWYCARFSLPLPLIIASQETIQSPSHSAQNMFGDCCAFASWEKSVALHGCHSAARAIAAAKSLHHSPDRALREKLFDNPNNDMPILSFFNFQNYAQADWDHPDLSEILVSLVEACETRDLLPVIECVFKRNFIRNQSKDTRVKNSNHLNSSFESSATTPFSFGDDNQSNTGPELDCYRTVLYLARYQCMTAFHAFFPTVTKACKGYHFWCPSAPWSIFDRAFREAAQEYGKTHKMIVPIPDISDVAIGFRCIFGHVI